MHALSKLTIRNYRSCRATELQLHSFTPIVGYNNAGKSNILNAIEWLLSATALTQADFNDSAEPVIVAGQIEGVDAALLTAMPPNQASAITPFVVDQRLRIRRKMAAPGTAATAKIEVRDPAVTDEEDAAAWRSNPTGLDGAIKALFPSPIRIHAMENAADDVGKSSKTNTIGRLIAAITEPVRQAHEGEFLDALELIRKRLSADGAERAAELQTLDAETTAQLAELFPGLSLKIDIAAPELPDLFKSGTVQVIERDGDGSKRNFDSLGHGAQRCIQMALIRHLASKSIVAGSPKRTLLLIDEPELYLHPQGIEQVRLALRTLSNGGYQIVFSTHSPSLITRDSAPNAVIVRKNGSPVSTEARNPLVSAARLALPNAPHQVRIIFELGRAAEVFFSDRVLIGEGKTESRLLPPTYESLRGKSMRADRGGLVSVDGCGNIVAAMKVLREMKIEVKAVVDLDFAFKFAPGQGLLDAATDPDLAVARPILARLAPVAGFLLETDGLPKKGGTLTPAEAWGVFAADTDGAVIAANLHTKLLAHDIWLWPMGTIEDALGSSGKGEQAIQRLELDLPTKTPADIRSDLPAITALIDWFSPLPTCPTTPP